MSGGGVLNLRRDHLRLDVMGMDPERCFIWGCGVELGRYADGRSKGRRGMCRRHYEEALDAGDLVRQRNRVKDLACEECGLPARRHWKAHDRARPMPLCHRHYEAARNATPERQRKHRANDRDRRTRLKAELGMAA